MPELLQNIVAGMEGMGATAYLLVALVVILETLILIGHFIPGGIFIAFVGFLCYLQVFDFPSMMLVVYLAHYAGETINYYIGRAGGRGLFSAEARWMKLSYLEAAEKRFERGGSFILITGQFIGGLRPFLSFAAGAGRYSPVKYLLVMVPGALLWTVSHLGVGFILGASWQRASKTVESLSVFLIVLVLAMWFTAWLLSRVADNLGHAGRWLEQVSRGIHRSRGYKRIASRNPRIFRLLEARVSLSRPWGLGATMGLMSSAMLAALFVFIFGGVREGEEWYAFDLALVNLLAQLRTPRMDTFFSFFTNLGGAASVLAMMVVAVAACLVARQRRSAAIIIGTVVLTAGLSVAFKTAFGRERPDLSLALILESGFSFPSAHSSLSVALFGTLYYWLWTHPGRVRLWFSTAFLVVLSVFLIGFSRIYLGVHYPSDVLAGFCLGLGALVFTSTVASNLRWLSDADRRADLAVLATLLVGVCVASLVTIRNDGRRDVLPDAWAAFAEDTDSTTTLVAAMPRDAVNFTGKRIVPTTLVVLGPLETLAEHLAAKGWEPVKANAFFTRGMATPVFPLFIDGRPARLTMQLERENDRVILRMWPTRQSYRGQAVWAGAVAREREDEGMFNLRTFHLTADADIVLDRFEPLLEGLGEVRRVSRFRDRGLYSWPYPFFTHGDALMVNVAGVPW